MRIVSETVALSILALGALACGGESDPPCDATCAQAPAKVSVHGDVLAFANEVNGARVEGATVSILEHPEMRVVTGPDAHFDFDGLDEGSEVTLVMEHPSYHTTQTGTLVLGPHGVPAFTIQAVSTALFTGLVGLVGIPLDEDQHCVIASTVARAGGSLYVHLRQGEAGAHVSLAPALPAESGPIYFNENVLPDPEQPSTSKDGGVVFVRVPPGDYVMTAEKAGAVFSSVKLKCREKMLVNAGPPMGVLAHVTAPDRGLGVDRPEDVYSAATGALCTKTAACVNEEAGETRYPPVTVSSCRAMFSDALAFIDPTCDVDSALLPAWKALFDCRASSCDLALGGDEACPDEDAAFVGAMATYGACYAAKHTP